MSKNSEGPSANSFENPRKVGWLQKHGGSGMSSHWKKRWFVVDHHYMFYFKGPSDKRPVGILCLPEYGSCHSTKESKKAHAFVLDKDSSVQEDSADSSMKNYVLCADSEEEMKAWVAAVTEEIKPMIGGAQYNVGGGGRGKGEKLKVDQKAFDEVAAIVSEGPKLTHLTASRPKMKGRRPPKRYQVFHEEEDAQESPPATPLSHQHKPLPPSPSPSSPNDSPLTAAKRGSRPSAPMLPSKAPLTPPTKAPLTPPTKTKANSDQAMELGDAPPPRITFNKPQPPRKATIRGKPADVPTPPVDGESPPVGGMAGGRPVPPLKKPRTSTGSSPPQTESVLENHVESKPRPVPPSKPRPRAKPRLSLSGEQAEAVLPQASVAATMQDQTAPEPPPKKPMPAARPTPIPRKRGSCSMEEAVKPLGGEDVPEEQVPVEDVPVLVAATETDTEVSPPSPSTPGAASEEPSTPTSSLGHSQEVTEEVEGGERDDEAVAVVVEEQKPSSLDGNSEEEEESSYQNVDIQNGVAETSVNLEDYELMVYNGTSKSVDSGSSAGGGGGGGGSGESKTRPETEDVQTSGEKEIALGAGSPRDSPLSEYENLDMAAGGGEGGGGESEGGESEGDKYGDRHTSMGFDPRVAGVVVASGPTTESPLHDACPPGYVNGDRPPSTASASTGLGDIGGSLDPRPPQSPEAGRRSNSLSSSGSGSFENVSMQARKGSKGRTSPSATSWSNSVIGPGDSGRESGSGNRKIDRLNSYENKVSSGASGKSLDSSDNSHSVSGTLQQAREILRLAQAMKSEAEDMKLQAYRELELARREKHDASLLKKNAAEILRIAKRKLAIK